MYINKNFTILLLKSSKALNLVKYSKLFRNFCISNETEKMHKKLGKANGICYPVSHFILIEDWQK